MRVHATRNLPKTLNSAAEQVRVSIRVSVRVRVRVRVRARAYCILFLP